ncbi:MAG: SpoIIE family protein phosphatase [Candidatus Limivivens sp.]|nr:SpoIIE family protein phosphatase [Candidatus Limivivens sp.]
MGEYFDTAVLEPGRARLEGYAQAFQNLSNTFRRMPAKREQLSREEVEEIFRDVRETVCSTCKRREICWDKYYYRTYRQIYGFLDAAETESAQADENAEFWDRCLHRIRLEDAVMESFRRARLNLMWSNRLLETRLAMVEQMEQTAAIIRRAAGSVYDMKRLEGLKRYQIEAGLRSHGLQVLEAWMFEKDENWFELYLTIRTSRRSRCIPVKEAAWWLSGYFGQEMVPAFDSRMIINREYSTVCFTPEPAYKMLGGVARTTREGEVISGDNFSIFRRDNGQMILSISDGMGSGPDACLESERVIELLEQFLEAGFSKETAVRMIHAALMLQDNSSFSSVDLCTVNLFSGECEFLKIGASTTFLRKNDWVESIVSTSTPMGILEEIDLECTRKQLEPGDFIVMVSDGVLDALPPTESEEIMKELIRSQETASAGEMAKNLLQQVLNRGESRAVDDMTVLVGGFWER